VSELGRILALTDEVEKLVAEGRWGDASAAESERLQMLVRYVRDGASETEVLSALHQRSVGMLARVGQTRNALAADAVRDFGGARAVDAYRRHAGPTASDQGDTGHAKR
jgi:hypothetical protein